LHPNANTTIRVTNEIQEFYESILKLAKKYSLNPNREKTYNLIKSGAKTVRRGY